MSSLINSEKKKNEFEVNIVPIIDCFTVLITFLLVSVSFLSVGFFQVQPMILSSQAGAVTKVSDYISVQVSRASVNPQIDILVKGSVNKIIHIPGVNGEWDEKMLISNLLEIRQELSEIKAIGLNAPNDLSYLDLISLIKAVQKVSSHVLLEGFE
jgi:biopolymer transport protein ExbD